MPLPPTSRRGFIRFAGTSAAGAILSPKAAHAQPQSPSTLPNTAPSTTTPLAHVNLLQGTNSTGSFSRGNTLPLVALPHGMAHWTIQSQEDTSWFFRPADNRCQGLRCTHQLSPWLPDYGYATFLPFTGNPDADASRRSSSYRADQLILAPHQLKLHLERYRCAVSLIPTERCCLLEMTFEDNGTAGLLLEMPGKDAAFHTDQTSRTVLGTTHINDGAVPANFATFYAVRFDRTISSISIQPRENSQIAFIRFHTDASRPVIARIATSFISPDQAWHNLTTELGEKPSSVVLQDAAAAWDHQLSAAQVQGGSPDQRTIFYSSLYRASLFPRIWYEKDATGNPIHYSPYTGSITPGVMYADHGYWDVYRAWYPLMSILYPNRLAEILQAWVNVSKEGGWMPQFPSPGYRACMTGSLIDAVFGDAACKDLTGFDMEGAYTALHRHATQPGDPDKGYGRRGIEYYMRLGYIPNDKVHQATVETLDCAYGDLCIAQVAKSLGKTKDAVFFLQRSANWRNVFDPTTKFMRGRNADGSWLRPFDPFTWGSPYVEGSAWQHRWAVPHDIDGLAAAMGGPQAFTNQLEAMLALQPIFRVGVYGEEIHEMSEMAAANFGQYAHSNQPVHHALYLFAAAGKPSRTQFFARRVMNELYTVDDFPGDEDTGSMAAWYILSALGFYPPTPGRAAYVLGSPIFERANLRSDSGQTFTITAPGNSENTPYVKAVAINNNPHNSVWLDHHILRNDAELRFTMSPSSQHIDDPFA